jgi:hypothetical protein
MGLFRELDEEETIEFKEWARDNHHAGQPINPVWHPVVRSECERIDHEGITVLSSEEPCYDCGSTITGHHTPSCEFSHPGDKLDLPQRAGSQHWDINA